MLRTMIVAACAALVLGSAGVAGASNGKDRVLVERFGGEYSFGVDCAEFGPYSFEILVEGEDRGSVTDVFDGDGALVQTVFHISLQETATNAVTGRELSLKGNVHEVWDYASNTRTVTGVVYMGRTSDGKAFQDTGRIDITLDTREATFVAGPHDVFFGGGLDAVVCAALAGA
ncbi:MAG: hypothetical protein ACR2HI_01335 [Gaiella sp.]